ncbi:restriction endonuclease subunit S [Limosilactobacillus reuteri]|uniref:restriction endonuclease subunit S n=1 Tax=Limosilactobacillus reuteri TaxID=1598 RepID=UPI001E5F3841|nr:restriction endonuclease subunit S [Limosilactobacillus reuteri]MCC4468947.1 restriction endonuclease subunit S [Limosilactobacillus reuteri]
MDKKPEKLVPEVRFKGFTDDWEQHKLGEISFKVNTKNKENLTLPVLSNSAEYGIVNQEDYFDKKIANRTDNYYIVKHNDFVYNPRISKKAPYGPIRRNTLDTKGLMSPLYYVFRINDGNYIYLDYYFKSSKWYKFMYQNGDSGARSDRFAIKDKIFQMMPISMPNTKEQNKIGQLIQTLQKLIDLQQRKLEQLKQLKKAMLQQLFIDKKSKQPNLRFKIFNGDWEQRKFLDEIDSIIDYRGKTPKKLGMSWSKTGYLALSTLNVKNGWIDKKSKDSHFGSQALYDIWMKNTPLYKDQVVFTTEAPMGNVAQIPDNEKYILSQRTIAFNPSQRLIDGFLADLLSTKNIQNKLMSLATGGTAKGVSQKSLKFLKIAFPSNEEQNFIHKVIKLFQILITLQQNKLTQLTTLKKYLLQNLFI